MEAEAHARAHTLTHTHTHTHTHTEPETMSTSLYERDVHSDLLLFYPLIGSGRLDAAPLPLPGSVCISHMVGVDFSRVTALSDIGSGLEMGVRWFV